MPQTRRRHLPIALAASALAALALAMAAAPAQVEAPYAEPDFWKPLFARESVLLEAHEVTAVVEALVALASNFPAEGDVNHSLRAKAMAIALRLEGTHPGARAANSRLKAAELPEPVSGFETLADVAGRLWTTASYLQSPEMGDDERTLQFCLVDIAREIDPTNLAESNRYPTGLPDSIFEGWQSILGSSGGSAFVFPRESSDPAPEVSATAPPVASVVEPIVPADPTRSAQGSYRSLSASGSTSSMCEIRGDLKAGGGTAPLAIIFADGDGDTSHPLNSHRGALVSALTDLYGNWPQDGGVVVLSVSDEDADDGALLLPSAILADSLIRERLLDPRTIALGSVADDGSVIGVEQLRKRLAAFKSSDVDTILIPEENLPELRDMALLGELAPFFRFQIILVSSLVEAAGLVAGGRDADFETNLRKFNNIRTVAKDATPSDLTRLTVIQSEFREITKLNPNHASAVVLLEHGSSKLPAHLTQRGSLNALFLATQPVVNAMRAQGSADRDTVIAAFESVTKIQPILDPETAVLGGMMGDLLKDIGNYASMTPKTSPAADELKDKIFATWETVREESARLQNRGG